MARPAPQRAARLHRAIESVFVPKFLGRPDCGSVDDCRGNSRRRQAMVNPLPATRVSPSTSGGTGVGITNYNAMLGTHIDHATVVVGFECEFE